MYYACTLFVPQLKELLDAYKFQRKAVFIVAKIIIKRHAKVNDDDVYVYEKYMYKVDF